MLDDVASCKKGWQNSVDENGRGERGSEADEEVVILDRIVDCCVVVELS